MMFGTRYDKITTDGFRARPSSGPGRTDRRAARRLARRSSLSPSPSWRFEVPRRTAPSFTAPTLGARIASEAKNHRAPLTGGARTLRACSRVPLAPHTAALSQITHGAHDGTSLHAIATPPSGAGPVPPRPRSITLSYVEAASGNERRRVGAAAAESRGAHCTGKIESLR